MEERKEWKNQSIEETVKAVDLLFEQTQESKCPVDNAKRFLKSAVTANCGECVICREGIYQTYTQVDHITKGLSSEDEYSIMKEIADTMKETSRCEFGIRVGEITAKIYAENDEVFLKHIKRKRCDERVCEKLSDFLETLERPAGGLMGDKRRRRRSE